MATLKLRPEVKSAWTTALLSGRYLQGQGTLHLNGKYCCLGVLCDISGLGHWGAIESLYCCGYRAGDEVAATYPPAAVMEWAGLDPADQEQVNALVGLGTLNDDERTFAEIAAIIQEEF